MASYPAGSSASTFVPGVRVPLAGTGLFDAVTFSFFADAAASTRAAFGTLFVLSNPFTGRPVDLGVRTPGYLGASQSIVDGRYVFDPTFTLAGGSTYYFYANAVGTTTGNGAANVADGGLYAAGSVASNFNSYPAAEPNFRLAGVRVATTATPEPGTWAPLATGLVALGGGARRRRGTAA